MTTSFLAYLAAFLIITAGIAFGMQAAGIDREWIIAAVLIMIGIGVMTSLTRVREWQADRERELNRRPPPPQPPPQQQQQQPPQQQAPQQQQPPQQPPTN
jgi:hypothetical protein